MKTFIMHYLPHTERYNLLSLILKKEGLDDKINWLTDYDQEKVTYIEFVNNFCADSLAHQQRNTGEYVRYPLQAANISLSLKHKDALRRFNADKKEEKCLILENDAILHEGFLDKLNFYLKSVPDDYDALFIGQGCNKHIPKEQLIEGQYWYKKGFPADRTTDSIIFHRRIVDKLLWCLDHYKMAYPIDLEYSFWFRELKANVYWLEPPIVTQGSQIGLFESYQLPSCRFEDKTMKTRSDLDELIRLARYN